MPSNAITVAHSPDSDDAFMFYALAKKKIDSGGFEFRHVLSDIETLNRQAMEEKYEVTAISFHAYAFLHEKYVLLNSGASMGDRYGPLVVSKNPIKPNDLKGKVIAIPGKMTSAYLILKLFEPDFDSIVVPFDQVFQAVLDGRADGALVIHEGQLTYSNIGLTKVVDLGEWWSQKMGLPLPLGGNVIRKNLGSSNIGLISKILKESIKYGLEHREEALAYALQFARDMDPLLADRFVGMYVNERTLGYGKAERKAVQLLLDLGYEKGIISRKVNVNFADEND
ncbi:MAG: ABC transporter substrate-binding protein [Acidobacteriia bacterium]|jgi:1,4-dihydroxy-6-naphthoate synthase|nr:ABC transporter substrate-binding protein [Terriglobia bacterium]